ncbi:hypothetical protein VU12_12525 [Desulfobulbus sp. US4]|nr:hypothetical protein [Desulfobulbus sp. US4]
MKFLMPVFVDFIPDHLEDGMLYVCEQYKTAAHLCCCRCGEEVITPLSPADWLIKRRGNVVSLSPSIGNWNFACKSHYWIWKNQVIWDRKMSQWEIGLVQEKDKADKKAYIEVINLQKDEQVKTVTWNIRCWQALVRWWKSFSDG